MANLLPYFNGITLLTPFWSAAACVVLIWFSVGDSLTVAEKSVKKAAMAYLSMTGVAWLTLFFYAFSPDVFVIFNVPCLISFVVVPVLFYRLIYELTGASGRKRFSPWHYIAPGALTIALLVWSFFVPFDIQLQIVEGKGKVFPAGYEAYSRFFTSKPMLRFIFTVIYYTLTGWLLVRYYRKATDRESLVSKPARWVVFLIIVSLCLVVTSMVATLLPRERMEPSVWTIVAAISIITQHLLITYHIILREYLLYAIRREPDEEDEGNGSSDGAAIAGKPHRKFHSGTITHQKLEAYFRKEKPYLDTKFKIADLVEALDVNRSVISGFIARTYGVNFSRYVNRWRIKEVERLSQLPSNQGKSVGRFVTKAGFNDLRQYYRVLSAERAEAGKIKKKPVDNKNSKR